MRIPRAAPALFVAVLAGLAGGCESMKEAKPAVFGIGPGLSVRLSHVGGSAAAGGVAFGQYPNNVAMELSIYGLPVGEYRAVIHATGNCSSPNGFAAGPPWSPPGVVPPLDVQTGIFTIGNEGSTQLTMRLTGVTLEGHNSLLGRSVVVHQGSRGSLEAIPDVKNDRVACGVIGSVPPLF